VTFPAANMLPALPARALRGAGARTAAPAARGPLRAAPRPARAAGDGGAAPPPPPPPPPRRERWALASQALAGASPLPAAAAASLAAFGLFGAGLDLAGPGSVAEAVGVLAAVVAVHEAGHFAAARLQGIRVTKFAVGFGPPLLALERGGVEYSLRLIPLGGYVAFPDDDPESGIPADDPDLMRNRPVLDRALVTVAGVAMNVAFAYAVCVAEAATVGVVDATYLPGVKLGAVLPGTVAERAGLRAGDVLLRVGDLEVAPEPGAVQRVVSAVAAAPGKRMTLRLDRAGAPLDIELAPAEQPDGTGRLGVSLAANVTLERLNADGPGSALALGARAFSNLAGTVFGGLASLFGNFGETASRVQGPVAILKAGSEVARSDPSGLFRFAAIISLNLAAVNVLPLPGLDGGYLALQALEAVRGGKKIDADLERGVVAGGFLLLAGLGIAVIFRDVLNLTGL
jgi:membrane-associated protease RseP (regulator of RpoE activity)